MPPIYRWLFVAGLLVLSVGLLQKWIQQRWWLTGPLVATALGVGFGPAGLQLLALPAATDEPRVLTDVTRIALAVADMGVALRLPRGYPLRRWKSLAAILVVGMAAMALLTGLLVWAVLGTGLLVAMVIGAAAASTDPIVATTIVTGPVANRNLPARLRHFISAESGANDGAVYPLALLPILLLGRPADAALGRWAWYVVGWQVGGAIVLGTILGYAAARFFVRMDAADVVEQRGFVAYTLALTFVVLGAARLLTVDAILASFVAGAAYRYAPGEAQPGRETTVQQAVTKFAVLPTFVLFGVAIPWAGWLALGWRGLALAVLVLLLRRPPVVLGLVRWLRPLRTRKDVAFDAWFGPIGVSTIFYATLAVGRTGIGRIWTVASLLIGASLLAHGLTATPASVRMPPDPADDGGESADDGGGSESGDDSDGSRSDDGDSGDESDDGGDER